MMTDTHCHLYDEAFRPDFDDVLNRAREAGVEACVMPGIDRSSHDALVAVADSLPGFAFPCIGLHPTSVKEDWREELDFVKEHLSDRRWYAIGEIGLDEYWSKDFVKEQVRVLEEQIVMASAAGLPVIIHLREATGDFFRVLEDLRGVEFRGVMHAWSGSYETVRQLLGYADFKFGIGGVCTYKNAGVAAAIEKMSLDDLLLETDCPWLTPVPFRGRRNEPSYVRYVAEKIAQIKQLPFEAVCQATTANARALFKI
ncbi:MAG: TatD family hydrolase [Bacteroidales bacterium]|nr:TatD family hydrolase [Bacteroidales bacterium]